MDSNITKAIRATIKLGKLEMEVFQFPDESYGYEYSWLAELIGRDKQILSNKKSPYYLKAIVGEALTHQTIKVGGISASDNKKKYLTQDQLMNVLGAFGKLQNQACIDLLISCAIEALERRADAAFGKQRTEVERNDRITQCIIHAEGWRKLFTDWLQKDGCVKSWEYAAKVNELKIAAKLPIDNIGKYDARQVQIMSNAEVIYDAMRRAGMTHYAALKVI